MSVSIDGAGSLIGVDQGLNIVGLTTLTGGIILDDSISHIGDTDTKIRFPAADTFTVETAGSERLRITSGGDIKTIGNNGQSFKFNSNLGVGARNIQIWNSQQQPWHSFVGTNLEWNGTNYVKPSDDSNTNWGNIGGIVFEGSSSSNEPAIRFLVDTPGGNGTDYSLGSSKSTAIDNKTAACIAASGNVGIGTEFPDTQLQIFNSSTTGHLKIGGGNGAGNHRVFISCTETNSYIDSYGNNAYGKLRINAAPLLLNDSGGGSVGIGTTNPSETLTLNHANGASIGLEYAGSEHGTLSVNSAAMYARAGSGKHLILGGNATEALRLKSDGKAYFTGNLGLGGQTSPGASIHINNFGNDGYELRLTGNALQFNRTSSSYVDQINDTGSILFRMGSSYTEAMRIASDRKIHIGGNGTGTDQLNIIGAGSGINIARTNSGNASVNEWLGALGFKGYATGNSSSGADARIHANAAFNHSSTSAPANLIFSTKGTTQGPGNSPVERMRITYDGRVIAGKSMASAISSIDYCDVDFHCTGPLSVGSNSNANQAEMQRVGRRVINLYNTTYSSSGGPYLHLETSLWGGGSPHGNSEFIMGGFHIHGYRYSTSGVSEEIIYFHQWNGGLANYSRYQYGNWNPSSSCYVGSNGNVYIKLPNGAYYGFAIDFIQHPWYSVRDCKILNATFNNGTNL